MPPKGESALFYFSVLNSYLWEALTAGLGGSPPLLYFRRLPNSALCILTEFATMFLKLEEAGK